jgi:manganese transport protein
VLLKPLLGEVAPKLFGVALLASGQSSTITGTLAGQIVMEGFVNWRISPVYRRLITRLIAIVPAIITVLVAGDHAVNDLLILSQVTLSYALPFGVFPLIHISSDRRRMGDFANPLYIKVIAYTIAGIIVALNCVLLVQQFSGA